MPGVYLTPPSLGAFSNIPVTSRRPASILRYTCIIGNRHHQQPIIRNDEQTTLDARSLSDATLGAFSDIPVTSRRPASILGYTCIVGNQHHQQSIIRNDEQTTLAIRELILAILKLILTG